MSLKSAETLKQLRTEKNISQKVLAELLFVDRSAVASWETGRSVPDTPMLSTILVYFDTDVSALIGNADRVDRTPSVIVVDDVKIILNGSLAVLQNAMPNAIARGFREPSEALAFAQKNRVDLAFVDIEMGSVSGLDLCGDLLAVNPNMNVVFLTAHTEYSFRAWSTGACGFVIKPLTEQKVKEQLSHLRHPIGGGTELRSYNIAMPL